ncbi:MAG: hypothetical protein ACKO7W_21885 [Elainella sp.]
MIRLLGLLTGFSLLLSGPTTAAPTAPMSSHSASSSQEFERIEQPLGVRLGVTAAGIGLIGLELWWFLVSKPKANQVSSPPIRSSETQQGI